MKLFLRWFNFCKIITCRVSPRLYGLLCRYRSLAKFVVSGVSAATVDILLLYIFHGVFHLNIIFSTSAAFILSFFVSFYLQKFWTFSNPCKKHLYRQMFFYMLVAFINLNINGYLMHLLVEQYHIYYILSQIIVGASIGLESFVIYKFIIFHKPHEIIGA